ncbi:ovostatin-like [Mantella aurantiaca]
MYWRERWLLCALVLLGVLAGGRAELRYVLSSPVGLLSGETGKACVSLVGNNEKLDVNLLLQYDGKNTTIIGEDVSSPTYFQCADYKIPNVPDAVPVTLLLTAKGTKTEILERKTVVIKPNKNNCIFQMDKPIYKPGQKVMTRLVCLNSQLKPENEKFASIYLQDPSRTRIKQWLNQETQNGVLSFDFQLIKDAPLGSYSYIVERPSSYSLSQYFTVEEYVPPRFSVDVDVPNTVSALQDDVNFKVSATYTYGESVAGDVVVVYCKQSSFYGRRQNCFKEKGDLCSNITGKIGSDGNFKGAIDMTGRFMGLTGMSLRLDITVVEDGTGIQVKESRYVWVTTQPAKLNFDYNAMNQYYKRGISYLVVARLTDEQDNPISNEDIEIELDQTLIQTVKTDSDGKIEYGIDTSGKLSQNFTVKVSYKNPDQCYYADWRDVDYPSVDYTVNRFYSQSGSYLQAKYVQGELSCDKTYNIEVQYIISQGAAGEGVTAVPIYYIVLTKSKIVSSGQKNIDLTNSKNGSITIALPVCADMAPSANLVIYGILKKEIIVETISLDIENCFKNKVDMAFSQEKGLPGSKVDVLLSATPNSICGLRVIDYSLTLLNRYEQFSPSSIYSLFSDWSYGFNVAGFDVEDPEPPCEDPNKLAFYDGNYFLPVSSSSEGDSYGKLKSAALVLASNVQTRKPKVCDNNPPDLVGSGGGVAGPGRPIALKTADMAFSDSSSARSSSVETIRTNFADSFLWIMAPVDKDGHASLSEVVPDTITKWQGTSFCLSDKSGFGMTKYPANFTTYLPFFVELTKPYSFIRGETLVLVGVVHNYLDSCVKVEVVLGSSNDFTAVLKEGTQNACVCSKDRATFAWEVEARVLGEISFTVTAQTTFIGKSCDGPSDDSQPSRKDTVVQSIIVEPEGISQEMTLSNLVFVKTGMKSTLPVHITPPSNVVPDSISAYVIAVGDVFGLPLRNLEDLVQKPYGCAEQNLARVLPIVYVLDYLNSTGQLTNEILERGKQYILEGYYRQLGYASGDAYKVFGGYGAPNSWLTAYSFMTFEEAKKYVVDIDETRQQQTLIWLENQQRLDNGCFKPQGSLFTFQNTNSDLHYTAFLATVLLKTKYSLGKTLLEGALECLKNASKTNQKIGDEVLMLYAFTLADLPEYRDPLMAKLMKKAISKEGTIHWEREDMPARPPVPFFLPIFAPPEVQLTSYMLLSLITRNQKLNHSAKDPTKTRRSTPPVVTQKDVATMAEISLWLTRQQNANGGFPSTSDTVVALQALGAFAKMLYTPDSQQTIVVKNQNSAIGSLRLDPENRLLVQRKDLPDPIGDYSLETEGNGWCLIQTTVKYNIPVPKEHSAFALALSTTANNCIKGVTSAFYLNVSLSYQGQRNVSGMSIVNIRFASGYHEDYWSLKELVNANTISKFEMDSKGQLNLYLDSVGKETLSFSFRVLLGERVLNVKSSFGLVYDYYDQSENGYASYNYPCVQQS